MKSISSSQILTVSDNLRDGSIASSNRTPNPENNAISTKPTVRGSFRYLWFKKPNIETKTKIIAGSSSIYTSKNSKICFNLYYKCNN